MGNHVYIATSLDGYIADSNGGLDWLYSVPNPQNSDLGFVEFIDGIDAIVMGRVTFETVCGFGGDWPYPKPTFVLTSTLDTVPTNLDENVELISGSPLEVTDKLNKRGFKDLYIDGGKTIQSFLQAGLVDDLIISTLPVLLGGGATLFGKLSNKLQLSHIHTDVLLGEIVQSRYRFV
ncbi:MAG: dihydrofolate reductase family protein [Pseudohongiella sp.]|uniref:dihydrofolate reductase family protein n=1 Tax=Pseudohongiella sp. TaxID=1979412 RepID=UPI0034A0018E